MCDCCCSLCQRQVLEELVTLITEEPSQELDERVRFKYANIACELLTCDVPTLNESLSRDPALLDKLYAFIEREPPLNPLLASFLGRTLGVLIVKRIDQVCRDRMESALVCGGRACEHFLAPTPLPM